MNYLLIPGDDASFGLVIKDYCTFTGTAFISFQMLTCHLCGIILPFKILSPAELIKRDCLFVSIHGEAACVCLGICCLLLTLPTSGIQSHEPSTKNYKIGSKSWLLFFFLIIFFWFLHCLTDNELWSWFQDMFSGIFQACWGPEMTYLVLIVRGWDSDVISRSAAGL